MKRLALLLLAAGCVLVLAVPAAQTAPTSDVGCTVEHLSNTECQGPDDAVAANACEINTWVGNARCDLTVPDGVASDFSGFTWAYAELQNDTWHAEFHYVIRDKSTGQVLFSHDASDTSPVSGGTTVPSVRQTFPVTALAPGGFDEVQQLTVDATGGTYTITFRDQTTAAIAWNATASELQAALEALSNIAPGDVGVTGGPGDAGGGTPYVITFQGAYKRTDVAEMTTTPSLTGGAATATVTTTTQGAAGGGVVECEVTGTHSPAGAALSGLAAIEGVSVNFNNRFRCQVN